MGHYKSNVRDIEFNLFEVLRRQDLLGSAPYADLDEDTARGILDEVNRLATGPIAESFAEADRNPPVFDPATGSVRMPAGFKKSFAFQAPKRRIQCSLLDDQRIVTLAPDQARNGITMERAPHKGLQDQDIQRAAQKLEFRGVVHSLP